MSIDSVPEHKPVSSPGNSPWRARGATSLSEDEVIDAFFSSPPEKSLGYIVTDTPSKKSRTEVLEKLPVKFRARDSGIALDADSSDDETRPGLVASSAQASSSLSSIYSESDGEALITPGFGPGPESGWPVGIVRLHDGPLHADIVDESSVDAFIYRTLTAQAKPTAACPGEPQRVPGTPVKRFKTSHLINRPWQSAVSSKVGLPEFDPPQEGDVSDKRAKPRKSLPAAFFLNATAKEPRTRKDALNFASTEPDDDEEASPSTRKQAPLVKRPPVPLFHETKSKTASWLMGRSSSGTYSSGGSDASLSQNATPTRRDPLGKCTSYC